MAVETSRPDVGPPPRSKELERKDAWWIAPLQFFLLFSAFGVWATFRAFQNNYFNTFGALEFGGAHYLSPFYSPTIDLKAWLGLTLPNGWAISPALLILPFPLSFRLSCYYYRRSLYRSYLADPLACAVAEPKPLETARYKKYRGERAFPLIVQNFHRFAFYAAVVFIILLWKDAIEAFFFTENGGTHFGVHVGSLVFLINICLLSMYTFSCHSWRHLIGGNVDCYSCTVLNKSKHGLWQKVSFINETHGRWAMWSLVSVALTDVYVYLVATHHLMDIKFF